MNAAFPLIEVTGTAYELGYQHGAQAGTLVRQHLNLIEKLACRPRGVLCQQAEAYLPYLDRYAPALVAELRGLAEGAGITFNQALLCQLRSEATATRQEGCSAFALAGPATRDGLPLAGQNQDLEPEFADIAILLRVRPADGRPPILMLTFAGQLGYAGLNAAGLALFHNALYDGACAPGIARQALKRLVLGRRSVAEALAGLAGWPSCLAGNLALADAQGAVADVELRAGGAPACLADEAGACLHTNHFQAPQFLAFERGAVPDSAPRLARLRALVKQKWGAITVNWLKTVLADHQGAPAGICRHGAGGWHSIAGYIAEPGRGLLHVRRGYGCTGTWNTYRVA